MAADDRPQITLITPAIAGYLSRTAGAGAGRGGDRLPAAVAGNQGRRSDAALCRCLPRGRACPRRGDRGREPCALVERLGLDGVHLTDGARTVRKARKDLGADAIVGAFCGVTRHEGISAGEAGADYAAFGPIGATGLGEGDYGLFQWWSEMIEVPDRRRRADRRSGRQFRPGHRFLRHRRGNLGREDPVAALKALLAPLGYSPDLGPRPVARPRLGPPIVPRHARCGSPARNAGPAPCGLRNHPPALADAGSPRPGHAAGRPASSTDGRQIPCHPTSRRSAGPGPSGAR